MTVSDYFQYEAQIARNHLVPLLLRHGALAGGVRVLDVGCGYGGTLLALREAVSGLQGLGLDLGARMVRQGQERLGEVAKLVQADFFQWSGGPFDLVLMRDVLEHIRDPELALARAAALLAPTGFCSPASRRFSAHSVGISITPRVPIPSYPGFRFFRRGGAGGCSRCGQRIQGEGRARERLAIGIRHALDLASLPSRCRRGRVSPLLPGRLCLAPRLTG